MNALLTIIVTTCDSLFFCVCKDRLRYYRSRWRFPAWRLCFLSLSVCLCLCVSCCKVMRSFTQQSSCVLLRRHLFFIIVCGGMCLFSFCVYLPRFFFFWLSLLWGHYGVVLFRGFFFLLATCSCFFFFIVWSCTLEKLLIQQKQSHKRTDYYQLVAPAVSWSEGYCPSFNEWSGWTAATLRQGVSFIFCT